jgi:hypothetical protein
MPATIYTNSVIKSPERTLPDYSQGRVKALNYTVLNKGIVYSQHVPWAMTNKHNWGITLKRVLLGDLGLPFGGQVKVADWNCIIHDLIQVGQGIIPSRTKRGNALQDVINIFNDFNEYENYGLEIEDKEGISTVYVIVRDKKAEIKRK